VISNYVKDGHFHETILNSNSDARIEYYLDDSSYPSLMSNTSDFCIGKMVSATSEPVTNTTATSWSCMERAFTVTSDGWWSFPISSLGTYGLIVNPDPLLIDLSSICDSIWCEFKLAIILGVAGFLAVVAITFFLIICCRRRKKNMAHEADDEAQPLNPPQEQY
jgi:hypothetical protein